MKIKIGPYKKNDSKRKIKIRIDKYDTWSMDHTLALIILPMLKQLRETKQGSAIVELEDVPEELRCITHQEYDSQTCFDFYHEQELQEGYRDIHARWNWVMDEMIFAFEHLVDDSWEDQFFSGKWDYESVPCEWDENNEPIMYKMVEGPNHTYNLDYEGMKKVNDRIDNGLRLFGRYYRGLWD